MTRAILRTMKKQPAVYIMANRRNGTLYVGVTSNLSQRAWQHRTNAVAGFTKRYGCKMLVWYELHSTMLDAIAREKQIKGGSRKKKLELIERANPAWRDLYEELI
jgi:putative endonuclease